MQKKTIEQTVQSVQQQTHHDIEHIVVDGVSTDATLSILKKHESKLANLISEPDEGLYDAMNKGINLASGHIIGTLNADDFYANDAVLADVVSIFEKDASLDACYADLVYVDAKQTDKIVRYWTSQTYKPGLVEKGWMPAHPTFFARKSVYERYGLFNTDLVFQSDLELMARLFAIHQIKSRYIDKIWIRMRVGGKTNQSFSNIMRGYIESYRACKKLGLDIKPWHIVTKFAMRIPQYFRKPNQL